MPVLSPSRALRISVLVVQDESSLSDIYLIVNWHNDYIQLDLYKIMMERYVHVRATCIGV